MFSLSAFSESMRRLLNSVNKTLNVLRGGRQMNTMPKIKDMPLTVLRFIKQAVNRLSNKFVE